jgi:hypothetical protein
VTPTPTFTFSRDTGPTEARAGWIRVGMWGNAVLWYGANGFFVDPFGPAPKPLDDYEVGAAIYTALKDRLGLSHKGMAEALGVGQRTAEGMALGRVSRVNRTKLARLASTV